MYQTKKMIQMEGVQSNRPRNRIYLRIKHEIQIINIPCQLGAKAGSTKKRNCT